ncbi:MAG: Bax inhibitor-1/YccA family protein [Aestuariivita sp.]|nr:Bax inhibitor-1/YccA family protein [Aestuariivita sp.]
MAEFDTIRTGSSAGAVQIDQGLRAHMNKVYGTMSIGMLLTFAVAWSVGTNGTLLAIFRNPDLSPNILGWVIMFAPLIMVFAFGAAINKLSAAAAQLFFYTFACIMGLSIAWIFVAFNLASIAQVFLITSIAFAGLSLWGYTTKKDISGWGSFLIMGVIGLVIASIINLFIFSDAIMFVISVLGVLIFAGLTAYDTQNIKNTYLQAATGGNQEWLNKATIIGALSLYINFINMFMMLLHLFGNRE